MQNVAWMQRSEIRGMFNPKTASIALYATHPEILPFPVIQPAASILNCS
jgi:hypothetical protein